MESMIHGKISENKIVHRSNHIPSEVAPDTLITFTTELRWLKRSIELKMLSPRYCEEDLRFLKVKNVKSLAFPMKCFCDINLSKLDIHMQWYGYYGLAFSKKWGMDNKIQPVHYINTNSELEKDISKALRTALVTDSDDKTIPVLKNYLSHDLMYIKPYSGQMKNRNTGKMKKKCLADECEWRFVPNVKSLDMPQAIPSEYINELVISNYSNALEGEKCASLSFEYSEIKYIIVKTQEDANDFYGWLDRLDIAKEERYCLLSKVIVWESVKGDF